MNRTQIEWCDYTINPVKGLCPMGCSYCYARRMYKRFKWEEKVRWYPPAWDLVDTLKKPSRVFVGSTFELFHESLPYNWMEYNLLTIKKYPQHTFIFLTKQPQNLPQFSPFPDNAWLGVTATDTYMAVKGLQYLDKIQAKVKFISFEPLLSQTCMTASSLASIGWVIIGQQTPVSAKTQPKIEWIKEIVDTADKAGVKVFLKDNLNSVFRPEYEVAYPWAYKWGKLRQVLPK